MARFFFALAAASFADLDFAEDPLEAPRMGLCPGADLMTVAGTAALFISEIIEAAAEFMAAGVIGVACFDFDIFDVLWSDFTFV